MAYLVYKHNSYFGVFSVKGRKHWIRIGKVDKKDARKVLKQLELQHIQGKLNLTQPQPITLFDFIDNKYLGYIYANKAKDTCRRELEIIKHIKAYFGDISLTKIDTQMIEGYKVNRIQQGINPNTINKELAIIRFMLGKAVEWKYLTSNCFNGVKMLLIGSQNRPRAGTSKPARKQAEFQFSLSFFDRQLFSFPGCEAGSFYL